MLYVSVVLYVVVVYYCQLNSCQNDGTCEEMKNGFTCHCLDGFVGTICESESESGTNWGDGNWGTGETGTEGLERQELRD